MNPMNTQNTKPTKRIPHVRVLSTLAALCLIESLIANVSFAQVNYSPFSYPGAATTDPQGPTGVRSAGGNDVYVTGVWNSGSSQGLLYVGPLSGGGNNGTWTVLNYPGAGNTSLYGPNGLPSGNVRLVGSYTTCDPTPPVRNHGLLYQGPTDGSSAWRTIDFPISAASPSPSPGEEVHNTIAHSTMGRLVVGNFDTNFDPGGAWVYDVVSHSWKELPKGPPLNAKTLTAYGIWYNGGTSYTIAGGYSDPTYSGLDQHSYLVHWDSATQMASDWTSYDFNNGDTRVLISHFDGITTDNQGGFYLTGTWEGEVHVGGFFAHVPRMPHRPFGDARWKDIEYPSSQGAHVDITTGNTVFENKVLGIFTSIPNPGPGVLQGYVATVPVQ
jgi:hypothetical protein